jgi:hypothetical protein
MDKNIILIGVAICILCVISIASSVGIYFYSQDQAAATQAAATQAAATKAASDTANAFIASHPSSPTTSPTTTTTGGTVVPISNSYQMIRNVDYMGQGDIITQTGSLDIVKAKCDTTSNCNGFFYNGTTGFLKNIASGGGTPNADNTGDYYYTGISPNTIITIPLYRLYNPANSIHMESTSSNEAGLSGGIIANICSNNISGTVPLYRAYYSGDTTFHLSSVSLTEITNAGYVLDGTLGYVYPTQVTGTVPVYRRYNSSIKDHMLTKDQTEGGAGYVTDNNAPLFYSF